jgi:Gas vesicle protein
VRTDLAMGGQRGTGLVDLLDRVLDKGLLIAGDIRISLAEVELLTIRIRLIVCSIDKAQEIGLDWWKYDRNLAPGSRARALETEALRRQVRLLERRIAALTARQTPARRRASRRRTTPAVTTPTGG